MTDRNTPRDTPRNTPRPLDHYLSRAGVRNRYARYDLPAAEARLLRSRTSHRCPWSGGWSDPARDCPVDAEQARRDLKAVCLAVVCAPGAGADLDAFPASHHTDRAGALAFACLLHLSGLRDGARFWWQFAAGAGCARAAYCLFLDHSRRGEHHDARTWADELAGHGFRPGGQRELREVRLCAQAAVLRHVDQCEDADLGPVPLPRPGLVVAPTVPADPIAEARGTPGPALSPPFPSLPPHPATQALTP
ncbi:hypothetical protein, partial [Streptomyces bambusae]